MQHDIKKSAMINGLIVGGMLSLKFLLGTTKLGLLSALAFAVSILIIYALYRFAVTYRDKNLDGIISYRLAFRYIFQIYFYGSIISSLTILIYTGLIDKDYLPTLLNDVLKMYDKMNFPVDEATYSMFENIYKPATFALFNVIASAITAGFWGLVLAGFVKKEKSIFE